MLPYRLLQRMLLADCQQDRRLPRQNQKDRRLPKQWAKHLFNRALAPTFLRPLFLQHQPSEHSNHFLTEDPVMKWDVLGCLRGVGVCGLATWVG